MKFQEGYDVEIMGLMWRGKKRERERERGKAEVEVGR